MKWVDISKKNRKLERSLKKDAVPTFFIVSDLTDDRSKSILDVYLIR